MLMLFAGRGITILLKGEPGVGKTLTAEAGESLSHALLNCLLLLTLSSCRGGPEASVYLECRGSWT